MIYIILFLSLFITTINEETTFNAEKYINDTVYYTLKPESKITKKQILKAIRKVESNDGKNTDHTITWDGTSAIGHYGLMPVTIREMISKNKELGKYKNLLILNNHQIEIIMKKNPKIGYDIASTYYDKLNNICPGNHNAECISYGWLMGATNVKRALSGGILLQSNWHVKKVIKALEEL